MYLPHMCIYVYRKTSKKTGPGSDVVQTWMHLRSFCRNQIRSSAYPNPKPPNAKP